MFCSKCLLLTHIKTIETTLLITDRCWIVGHFQAAAGRKKRLEMELPPAILRHISRCGSPSEGSPNVRSPVLSGQKLRTFGSGDEAVRVNDLG